MCIIVENMHNINLSLYLPFQQHPLSRIMSDYIVHSGFAGWTHTTVCIFNLYKGWLSLYCGPAVNITRIRRTAHLFNAIFANDIKKNMFWHQFVPVPCRDRTCDLLHQTQVHKSLSYHSIHRVVQLRSPCAFLSYGVSFSKLWLN